LRALRDDLLATNQRLISYVGALETMIARPNGAGKRRQLSNPRKIAGEKLVSHLPKT